MAPDMRLAELRTQAETALATYERCKDAPAEVLIVNEPKVHATLESIAREIRRLKSIHASSVSDTQSLPLTDPRPIDPEIRTALRAMTEKQRDAILDDPSSGALKAVLDAPGFLSGISQERQSQLAEEALVRRYGHLWEQQEIEAAALKDLQEFVNNALHSVNKVAA